MPFNPINRRDFLKGLAAAGLWLLHPKIWRTRDTRKSFWFLHKLTGDYWQVENPANWCLGNAQQPHLARAKERLLALTPADETRIIRLVTRRCGLTLLETSSDQVTVHYWGQDGQGDLRPFFKAKRLAKRSVDVCLIERKREIATHQSGDDFLYGERPPLNWVWPWCQHWWKWERRFFHERSDWKPAPGTWSGYGWKGLAPNAIPWAALKSAWRRSTPLQCPNCDLPALLVDFGFPQEGFLTRSRKIVHLCRRCKRLFNDHSDRFTDAWLMANLDADVLPDHFIVMGTPTPWRMRKKTVFVT